MKINFLLDVIYPACMKHGLFVVSCLLLQNSMIQRFNDSKLLTVSPSGYPGDCKTGILPVTGVWTFSPLSGLFFNTCVKNFSDRAELILNPYIVRGYG